MIRRSYWHKVPSAPVLAALPLMTWQRTANKSAASETAALMLYVALIFMAEMDADEFGLVRQLSAASYDDLELATGLSRKLVSDGLKRLIDLKLIAPQGSHQKRRYVIAWPKTGWFKLPCQAIVSGEVILPFKNFTLRSKHELHAMKLYLYLAACRDNAKAYSMASYETITERIGIPERYIRKAISLLIGTGLLRSVDREHNHGDHAHGPNKYFFTGSERLFGFTAATAEPGVPVAA